MPGPNSAPNGDKRLVSDEMACRNHGDKTNYCTEKCQYIRYREFLATRGQLLTGKTRR